MFHIAPGQCYRIGDFNFGACHAACPAQMLEKLVEGEVIGGQYISAPRPAMFCSEAVPCGHVPYINEIEHTIDVTWNFPLEEIRYHLPWGG